jgi:hypothetical protein
LVGGFLVFAAMKNSLLKKQKTGRARRESSATIAHVLSLWNLQKGFF